MQCHLCKQEKVLCRAHLAPEWVFRFMYPEGKVEGESLVMITSEKDYPSRRRIGVYDDSILCAECDNKKLGPLDAYGKTVFLDTEPQIIKTIETGSALMFKNVDVSKLKLFLLSVLWRFSISNLPELEKNKLNKLPDKFEEKLQKMILKSDPGTINDFSILICRFNYLHPDKNFHKYFQTPASTKMNSINYAKLYLPNGYKIIIKVDSRKQLPTLLPLTLDMSRPVYILKFENFEKTEEFQALLYFSRRIKI